MFGAAYRTPMAPVSTPALDGAASATGQWFATVLTGIVALAVVVVVVRMCWTRRIGWPLLALVSGAITCLLEPLYDHLYGLWFFSRGEWILFSSYGVHLPVWLPAIYAAYYGGGTVFTTRFLQRGATSRDVLRLYLVLVALAVVAEELYINAFSTYAYQGHQVFAVAGYPVWVAFVNSLPPVLAGIAFYRLLPLLRGWERAGLVAVVPVCFAAGAFGAGFLYLALRHSDLDVPDLVLSVAALVTVAIGIGMVDVAARLATGTPRPSSDDAAMPVDVPTP